MLRLASARSFIAALGIAVLCTGAEPVRPTAQPQKYRTFYSLSDPQVPAPLRGPSRPLPAGNVTAIAVAPDGAVWYGTPRCLVRVTSEGHEYFAGRRYLPDDEVLRLTPDKS